MFFIHSEDKFLIKKQLDKLIGMLNKENEYEVYSYSLIEDSIKEIYEEINTYSLFNSKKIIIISDCWFVNESKVKLHKDFDNSFIEKILANNNEDIEVFMTLNSEKFSKKLKIAKLVESNTKVMKLDSPNYDQRKQLICKKLEKNNISYDNQAIELFLNSIGSDLGVLDNEMSKLISLNKHITEELIKENVAKYSTFDVFEIATSFITNDLNKFLKGWESYIETNSNTFSFLALLSSQFTVLRNALVLKSMNYANAQIASTLGQNPYRVQKLLQENRLDIKGINGKIKALYELEKNIKEGVVDSRIIPEFELIKMFRK
ncbi:DNA polymerase III subunit delta [Spiroplasma chinense]|uniref:DNA polymerase III subunit delta n=1 Tax=Spiroplasma chinense TaxID=216932 RepID=A0A5B9Y720_9MOLU|nr:DNA polymerase III subunit delta [Spiroplasma chinense]QEH61892.1 DNA polymerase III subunit delta [Spiroplasma chinense]